MQLVNAVIVDDELHGRELVNLMLTRFFPEVVVEGKYGSVTEAVANIKDNSPRILFLDIKLGDGLSFEILDCIPLTNTAVIFITAFSEYSLQAFKVGAVDYLLKPLETPDFVKAVNRAKEKLAVIQNTNSEGFTFAIRSNSGYHILETDDIVFLESENNYTTFVLRNGEKIVSARTLKSYSDLLESKGFFRAHRSFLVNIKCIKEFRYSSNILIMEDGSKIEVSRLRQQDLIRLFNDKFRLSE